MQYVESTHQHAPKQPVDDPRVLAANYLSQSTEILPVGGEMLGLLTVKRTELHHQT